MLATALTFLGQMPAHQASSTPALNKTSSDPALIEAIARGDRHAMLLLFRRHSAKVYRFALRLVRDEGAAEDLVSEVFLQVWRNADRFEGRAKVSTWMLSIARRRALQALRRRSPEPTESDALEMIEDDSDGPDVILNKKETGSVLFDALKTLSTAHRMVIDLVYYHGMSVEDVARIVDIPVSSVKTRMFYARKQLANALAAAGHGRELLES